MASGAVVGWLNADDLYLPGALRRSARPSRADPEAEWATGRCRIVDAARRGDPQAR